MKMYHKRKAFFLCLFLGLFGAHKFYEDKFFTGILYIFTLGLFGIGWIKDLIEISRKPKYYLPNLKK